MAKQLILMRDVTKTECRWLDRDMTKGQIAFEYIGHTYGVVNTRTGIAVTLEADQTPFFELPRDALDIATAPHLGWGYIVEDNQGGFSAYWDANPPTGLGARDVHRVIEAEFDGEELEKDAYLAEEGAQSRYESGDDRTEDEILRDSGEHL